MIQHLCDWLASSWISHLFGTYSWFVPAVQCVHILAIAAVFILLTTLHTRLLGVTRQGPSTASLALRYLPWVWRSLGILLLTGLLLTITEPGRELLDTAFRIKMLLVLLLVASTLVLQRGWRQDTDYWMSTASRRRLAATLAVSSLLLCVCIIVAGRLIAYV